MSRFLKAPPTMMTMTENPMQRSWLKALAEAAHEQGILFPPFTGQGMGYARTEKGADGRFVTFKRRLVSSDKAKDDGIEWTLWSEQDGVPMPVAAFRVPLQPGQDAVASALALLQGWLVEKWPADEAKAAVGKHPGAQHEPEARPLIFRLDPDDLAHLANQPTYVTVGLEEYAAQVIQNPSQVFCGLKRGEGCQENLREGLAFCGLPRLSVTTGRAISLPAGMTFAVYSDVDGYVFDWDWVEENPGEAGCPVNPELRFGDPVTLGRQGVLVLPEQLPVPRFDRQKACCSPRGDCIFCYITDEASFACRINPDLTVFRSLADHTRITGFKVKNVRRISEENRGVVIADDPDLVVSVGLALIATQKRHKEEPGDSYTYAFLIEAVLRGKTPPNALVSKKSMLTA